LPLLGLPQTPPAKKSANAPTIAPASETAIQSPGPDVRAPPIPIAQALIAPPNAPPSGVRRLIPTIRAIKAAKMNSPAAGRFPFILVLSCVGLGRASPRAILNIDYI